jgi:uncharacterized protein (TIGR02271 family)
MTRTITAYFDSTADAQLASDRLIASGVSSSAITLHDSSTAEATAGAEAEEKGFWASLGDLFMPDEDRYTYSEGIRRGGCVVTVQADEADFALVSDVLEEAGSVDLDAREATWRSEGWSGYDDGTAGMGDPSLARERASFDTTSDREGYIPVAQEQLRVGKREVDHGRVRVRSYVVETPVEEHVSLHDEHVHLERNRVDRAATSADNLFQERTIEAEAHGEEAVVSKEARVVEEVRLSKDVQEREQVVSDTVRRTEVEVDDERDDTSLSAEERARRSRSI